MPPQHRHPPARPKWCTQRCAPGKPAWHFAHRAAPGQPAAGQHHREGRERPAFRVPELFAEMQRIMEISNLSTVTREVVETARESPLVIGIL